MVDLAAAGGDVAAGEAAGAGEAEQHLAQGAGVEALTPGDGDGSSGGVDDDGADERVDGEAEQVVGGEGGAVVEAGGVAVGGDVDGVAGDDGGAGGFLEQFAEAFLGDDDVDDGSWHGAGGGGAAADEGHEGVVHAPGAGAGQVGFGGGVAVEAPGFGPVGLPFGLLGAFQQGGELGAGEGVGAEDAVEHALDGRAEPERGFLGRGSGAVGVRGEPPPGEDLGELAERARFGDGD